MKKRFSLEQLMEQNKEELIQNTVLLDAIEQRLEEKQLKTAE